MYLEERRKKIVEIITQQEVCSVEELASVLNVSLVTIRKDLDALEKSHIIVRTFGGAMLAEASLVDTPYDIKSVVDKDEKIDMCRYASTLIKNNSSILIDAGSTVTELCPFIKNKNNITVITFNLEAAMMLSYYQNIQCVFIGGNVSKNSKSCTGAGVVEQLKNLQVDTAFIGCDGFDLEKGVYTTSLDRAFIKKEAISNAQQSILLASSTKYNQKKLVSFAPFKTFTLSIFDKKNPTLNQHLKQVDFKYKLI